MAQIYAGLASVNPGDRIPLHVSSENSKFRVDFYRQGTTLQLVGSQSFQGGTSVMMGTHDTDWGWPTFSFAVPDDWKSGAYLALCVEDGAPPSAADINDPSSRFAQALFVVRSSDPGANACILYKLPIFTYTAYNELADPVGSLYTGTGLKVTMQRAGCGVGSDPWDAFIPDVYDTSTPRQTFQHWDQKFIQWLESNNYVVDYCTDLDVHTNAGAMLSQYRLVLSVGHDEYWTKEERDNLEAFIATGGNVAFFSGNVCWWRVHLTDNNTALVCDKSVHANVTGSFDQWFNGQNNRPENSLTGVSYREAGGQWDGQRPHDVGYTVQYASHWVYQNVPGGGGALQDGDVIGDAGNVELVGYECDGTALAPQVGNEPRVAALTDGTPASFLVLGLCGVSDFEDAEGGAAATATMGIYTNNGIVFTAATADWARVVASGNAQVTQITRNVLDRLRSRAVRILGLGDACSRHPVVEGASITLWAGMSALPNQNNLSYAWTTSAGTPDATNQATFQLQLPSPPVAVTVSVTIADGTDCPAFGTVTFTPMTHAQYAHAALICRLRDMVATAAIFTQPLEGVREGNRFFIDPLWDPIRGYVGPELRSTQIRRLAADARQFLDLAERIAGRRG